MTDGPRMVDCVKLSRSGVGLDKPPFRNDLGKRVFEGVSKEAWFMWLEHAKMLINEYRIDLATPGGAQLFMAECEKYFFGPGSALPPDFKPSAQPSK